MNDDLEIFVDQLKGGKVESIERVVQPDFLEVDEPDLSFKDVVEVEGEAYLTNDSLVLHLDLATKGVISCSICNEPVRVNISLKGCYHIEPIKNVKAGIFDMREVIRASILLETPSFAECNEGDCPKRKTMSKYMKKLSKNDNLPPDEEGYHPFRDIDLER